MQLETNKEDFLSRQELKKYDYDFLSNSYENENGSYSYEVIDQSRSERMITRVREVQNETN